jgi:diacylglycerol O-acyltransferase / trehalose O-mycolyltransferase
MMVQRGRTLIIGLGMLAVLLGSGCTGGTPPAGSTASPTPPSSPPVSSASPTPSPTPSGVSITGTSEVDSRTVDLTILSPAVGKEVKVRLLLPADFSADTEATYPVLYLLHGCCDTYESWDRSTRIGSRTKKLPMIVAMPEGGDVGFYSDWQEGPKWETFHTVELPGLLAAEYRASDRAAVAGLSMGGLGALAYAARHPDQFGAVASFSGIVHTRLSPATSAGYLDLVQSYGGEPLKLWGDPEDNEDVWREHNPYDLAEKLKGRPVFISCGNGKPGPLDTAETGPDSIERNLLKENEALADQFKEVGVDAEVRLYGDGVHDWPYWDRELGKAWPMLTKALGVKS